jgi:hypothetical protein
MARGGAIDRPTSRTILYIACHGTGGQLTLGRTGQQRVNLRRLADYTAPGVEGVWFGACDVGAARRLRGFLEGPGGAVWAGGYVCSVD